MRVTRGQRRTRSGRSETLLAVVLTVAIAATACAGVVQDRLPNGVRVIVQPSPWNRVVSVSVLIDAGSKYDPEGLKGLARVTNDLLGYTTAFRTRDEVCRIAGCEWIDFGTTLTEDMAEVHASAIDVHFEEALDLVAGAVTEPAFTEADLAAVQVATQKEIERALDDPFERTYARLNELLFEDHPYAYPARGTLDGVARITREDVVSFHRDRYVGGAVVVAVVGDVDPEAVFEIVGERFEDLPPGVAPAVTFDDPEREETTAFDLFKDVREGRVQIGCVAPAADDPDYPAVRVLTEVLGGGAGSRLSSTLSTDGADVADVVGAFYPLRLEKSRLVAYATPKQTDAAVRLMSEEIERLRSGPVAPEEVERARDRIAGLYAIRGQRNIERARRIAWGELSGLGVDAHERLIEAVSDVDAEDVRDAAERYLENPAIVILRPGKSQQSGGI
jgi:predicted Zn-dependent peptidase